LVSAYTGHETSLLEDCRRKLRQILPQGADPLEIVDTALVDLVPLREDLNRRVESLAPIGPRQMVHYIQAAQLEAAPLLMALSRMTEEIHFQILRLRLPQMLEDLSLGAEREILSPEAETLFIDKIRKVYFRFITEVQTLLEFDQRILLLGDQRLPLEVAAESIQRPGAVRLVLKALMDLGLQTSDLRSFAVDAYLRPDFSLERDYPERIGLLVVIHSGELVRWRDLAESGGRYNDRWMEMIRLSRLLSERGLTRTAVLEVYFPHGVEPALEAAMKKEGFLVHSGKVNR